jgi:hypothetical protein
MDSLIRIGRPLFAEPCAMAGHTGLQGLAKDRVTAGLRNWQVHDLALASSGMRAAQRRADWMHG